VQLYARHPWKPGQLRPRVRRVSGGTVRKRDRGRGRLPARGERRMEQGRVACRLRQCWVGGSRRGCAKAGPRQARRRIPVQRSLSRHRARETGTGQPGVMHRTACLVGDGVQFEESVLRGQGRRTCCLPRSIGFLSRCDTRDSQTAKMDWRGRICPVPLALAAGNRTVPIREAEI
jgi:hypothetical protein